MVCGVNVNYGETGGQARRARRVKSYGHYAALSLGIGHGAEGIEHRERQPFDKLRTSWQQAENN